MKKISKRMVAWTLILTLLVGICPSFTKEVKAATSTVSLANLGSLGSMTAGSKNKTGKWWMMKVGSKKAFCMDLGYTCHSGDVYEKTSATYKSTDSGKKGLKAYIGYWYAETMKESRKAYVMAQALLWAVEEGDTSESKLKSVISTIKSNTGYFSSKTAAALYKQIFEKSGTFSVDVIEWKYSGSGSHRQELLVIDAGTTIEPAHVSTNDFYRQRIKLRKINEDGNPMSGAKFQISAENIDELYSYKFNGGTSDADQDISNFNIVTTTDANGWINLRLTYRLQTNDYFYLDDQILDGMSNSDKNDIKAEWDEMGYEYASDLSQDGAKALMEMELLDQWDAINNTYSIKEIDSGNENIIINPEYLNGKKISLTDAYSWTRGLGSIAKVDWSQVIEYPYELQILDDYKKVALNVKKIDSYSSDKKAHGEANLNGAVYGIYTNQQCTVPAAFFDSTGDRVTGNTFTVRNGGFTTPYLRCGQDYYIKELREPEGYKLNEEVKKITLDGGDYSNTVEYVPTPKTIEVDESPVLGKVAIQKYYGEEDDPNIRPEKGAVFQIYLEDNGSYDACDEYERDTLVIDENGYAVTKDLYYGDYIVHQVNAGGVDAIKVKDFPAQIREGSSDEDPITFTMTNILFKAYLRIIKKDGNTEKSVLKAGTTYQIYKVDNEGNETLVTQSYNNGNEIVTADRFVTDETGQIMTYEALLSAKYRIYEVDAATGLHISTPYIEVEINSQADNYKTEEREDGTTYSVVELTYINYEASGKLSIYKTGEQLSDFKDGQFVYEEKQLNDVIFEIYAEDDIVTQDNQGTNWFDKDELVATVTTGKDAVFTSECGGITDYQLDDGIVTVNLPLGKYRVVEKETTYGNILPEDDWKVEFTWENKDTPFVLNSTEATDENGIMSIFNERAKAELQLNKIDKEKKEAIEGATFGIYTTDNIYNADGDKIVDADTQIGTLVTDKDGKAKSDVDFPLMSEGFQKEVASGSAITVSESAIAAETEKLNSGDYYIKELSVSGSYYLDDSEMPVHFEYQDAHTPLISKSITKTNNQTTVQIDKRSAVTSGEVPGCELVITDKDGNVIVKWTSGDKTSIVVNQQLESMGYRNVKTTLDAKGNLIIKGLLHDTEYTLTETRPANGYVTAESISFKLRSNEDVAGNSKTIVSLKNEAGEFIDTTDHVVTMVDEITKVNFEKRNEDNELIGGAKIEVYDSKGNKVAAFITEEDKTKSFEGIFVVGETYTFKEIEAPAGYEKASDVTYTVKDMAELQTVTMVDKKMGLIYTKVPKDFWENQDSKTSPKTGYMMLLMLLLFGIVTGTAGSIYAWRKSKGLVPVRFGKKFVGMFLLLFLFVPCVSVDAATGESIKKEFKFETTNKNETKESQFPKQLEENGNIYIRENIKYDILSETPIVKKEDVSLTVKSDVMKKTEEYHPEKEIVKDGITYVFEKTSKQMKTLEQGYTQTVTGYSEYETKDEANQASSSKRIQATDPRTGDTVYVDCKRKNIQKMAATWRDTHIDILFTGYDANHFIWNDVIVEKNTTEPLKGYYTELLKSVGGNETNYKIQTIKWQGKSFKNASGVLCRKARASVKKKVNHYRVNYVGKRTVKAIKGIVYTSTYKGIKEVPTGEKTYQMVATATYQIQKKPFPVFALTVTIVLVILLVVGVLFIILKKNKQTKEESTSLT